MDYAKLAIQKHLQWHGKLSVEPKMKVDTAHALSLAYTPGVAPVWKFRKIRPRATI